MFASYNTSFGDQGLIWIETFLRRGIPAMDIVGLPGSAIREARDRIRAAVKSSGHEFPKGHILVNLAPAGVPKTRACLDLALALAVMFSQDDEPRPILVMGELNLSGGIRKVDGILPALIDAKAQGIEFCILPEENRNEAQALPLKHTFYASNLLEALAAFDSIHNLCLENPPGAPHDQEPELPEKTARDSLVSLELTQLDPVLMLGALTAVAGAHHAVFYGPPGSGKTMATEFMAELMPSMNEAEFLEVNRLYSLLGLSSRRGGLIRNCPVRRPHHSSSPESLLGARSGAPGEVSLAHRGVLVLDECPEFRRGLLQAMREPLDEGEIRLGRVEHHVCLPAGFQVAMTMNSCPCGGLGAAEKVCVCSPVEVQRYWGRIGAPLLDRVDIRVRTGTVPDAPDDAGRGVGAGFQAAAQAFLQEAGAWNKAWGGLTDLVQAARAKQYQRNGFQGGLGIRNGDLRGMQAQSLEDQLCLSNFDSSDKVRQLDSWKRAGGMRAWHSSLKLARTLADLSGHELIPLEFLGLAQNLRSAYEPVPGLIIQH